MDKQRNEQMDEWTEGGGKKVLLPKSSPRGGTKKRREGVSPQSHLQPPPSPLPSLSAPIRAESTPGSERAQRVGPIWTIIISGKIKMKPDPCHPTWKRQPWLKGREDSWKQPSQGRHMCAIF